MGKRKTESDCKPEDYGGGVACGDSKVPSGSGDGVVGIPQGASGVEAIVRAAERRIAAAEHPASISRWGPPHVRSLTIDRKLLLREMPYPEEIKPVEAAFNCSITEWAGKLWMAYRVECRPFFKAARIAVCELDKRYQPISESRILPLPTSFNGIRAEDPRWFHNGPKLYLAYNDNYRQWFCENVNPFEPGPAYRMKLNIAQSEREKNHSYFAHRGQLYSVYDHGENFRVLNVNGDVGRLAHSHRWNAHFWDYGIIRGGASPVLHKNVFYSFFHSSAGIDVTQFGIVKRYFAGVMTFEAEPPFKPLKIAEEPILRGIVEQSSDPKSSLNPAVFVCGARRMPEGGWELSYGSNNLNCGVSFVSDLLVEKLLRPVKLFT